MLKVQNRRVLNRLADKSFRASRTRNFIAILAILLTTVLFTTVFSIGGNVLSSFQYSTMVQAGGSAHGSYKNIRQEEFDRLAQAAPESVILDRHILCAYQVENPELLKRPMELWYRPADSYDRTFCTLTGGHAPQAADEIAMDERSLELLGIPKEEGQTVTLQLQLGNGRPMVQRQFRLAGWFGYSESVGTGFALVSEAYLEAHADELAYTYDQDGNPVGAIRADVTFSNSWNLEGKMDALAEKAGLSADLVEWNVNWAYLSSNMTDWGTIGAVAGLLLLIMFTGYLIIYNIFQISVIRDIRYYGLLKTIGTTEPQIRKLLRRQALVLCVFGIPLGLIIGFILSLALTPLIFQMMDGLEQVKVSMDPLIFVGAALFSLVTVLISMRRPATLAARVSPVEAVRYTEGTGRKAKKGKRSTKGGKLWRMALSNLGRNKRRTVLVVISMSLSLVLMNSVFTLTSSFDLDKYLAWYIKSEFIVANAQIWGVGAFRALDGEDAVSEELIANIQAQEGFLEGGAIWCDLGPWFEDYQWPADTLWTETGKPGRRMGNRVVEQTVDEENRPAIALYGVDDLVLEEIKVVEGESDPDIIREKMATGDYILFVGHVSDEGKLEPNQLHKAGDVITLRNTAGEQRSFTILSVIDPAYYCQTAQMAFSDFTYYTSAEVFAQMGDTRNKMNYAFNVDPEQVDEMEAFLERYTTQVEPTMDYRSKAGCVAEYEGVRFMFGGVGGLLSLVIGLIGVLNFVNSIVTSVVTRRREFAMLESIGMTQKQLRRMVMLEGCYYAAATILFSLLFGIGCSLLLVRPVISGFFFTSYRFILWPLLAAVPVIQLWL